MLANDVDSGDHLGDRVLDLHPGVDLEERELAAIEIDEELDRPRPAVVEPAAECDCGVGESFAEIVGHGGGRCLLDELLEAALRRAVPVAEVDDVAVLIAEQLHLDVPGVLDVPLHVHAPVPERGLGLARCRREPRREFARTVDADHPASAAPGGGLEEDRVTDVAGDRQRGGGAATASEPAPIGTPAARATRRASTLSPPRRIVSAVGPTKIRPWASHASASSARSDRKP